MNYIVINNRKSRMKVLVSIIRLPNFADALVTLRDHHLF